VRGLRSVKVKARMRNRLFERLKEENVENPTKGQSYNICSAKKSLKILLDRALIYFTA